MGYSIKELSKMYPDRYVDRIVIDQPSVFKRDILRKDYIKYDDDVFIRIDRKDWQKLGVVINGSSLYNLRVILTNTSRLNEKVEATEPTVIDKLQKIRSILKRRRE